MSQPLPDAPTTELVALRVMPTAVRCREVGAGPLTYRRSLHAVVPGQRLTVRVQRRWTFRHTAMAGGALLHAGFSLRALQRAGFETVTRLPDGDLDSPGGRDARLREAELTLAEDDWLGARCLLLGVLEDAPGCLPAHSLLGEIHAALSQLETAHAHFTAAFRLGSAAQGREPLVDPARSVPRALLRAACGRAALAAEAGLRAAAASDLRRATTWDPTDSSGAGQHLARLLVAPPARDASPGAS